MKKLLALLLMLCLLPWAALAELDEEGDCVIALPGVEVIFTPVEGAYLLTMESSASDFNALGMSQREIVPWMEEYALYALLFDENFGWELHVQVYTAQSGNYDDLSEVGMQMECNAMRAYYRESGYEVLSCEPWRAPDGHTYVCVKALYTYEDGTVEPSMELMTVRGGWCVSVYLFSYLGEVTAEQEALALELANSLYIKPQR